MLSRRVASFREDFHHAVRSQSYPLKGRVGMGLGRFPEVSKSAAVVYGIILFDRMMHVGSRSAW